MALAISPPAKAKPAIELTTSQKYQRLRERARVEVKMISHSGAAPRWIAARIVQKPNKGGAMCKWGTGLERFFHWNEIRPPQDDFDPAKPIASLGEIAKGALPALRAVPPYLDVEQPRPAAILISREDLLAGEQEPMPAAFVQVQSRDKKLPNRKSNSGAVPTAVGDFLKQQRVQRQISQLEVANLLSKSAKRARGGKTIFNSRVSQLELGKTLPTDDELIAYAETFKLDLDKLIDLRNQPRQPKAAPPSGVRQTNSAELRQIAETKQTPPPAPDVVETPTLSSAPLTSAPPMPEVDFASFTERLCACVPLPLDPEKRRTWFQLAVKLYQLGGQV